MTIDDEHNLNLEPWFDVKENTTFKKGISFENYFKGTTQIEIHDSFFWNDHKRFVAIETIANFKTKCSRITLIIICVISQV